QGDVGLQQGDAHLAHGLADVGLGQPAAAAQALEGAGQALGQGFEHAGGPEGGKRPAIIAGAGQCPRPLRLRTVPGRFRPRAQVEQAIFALANIAKASILPSPCLRPPSAPAPASACSCARSATPCARAGSTSWSRSATTSPSASS